MTQALTVDTDRERERKVALLRSIGLDRVSEPERELALAIAKRYDLDLLLKHLVLIDGKAYITRDGLLHIAHRSGQLDGMVTTKEPTIEGDFWNAQVAVYRKDMGHPFTYGGRYPVKGQNQKFAPEMALKVAESMSLRRAFDVAAPSADERWDVVLPAVEPPPVPTLAERAAAKAARQPETVADAPGAPEGIPDEADALAPVQMAPDEAGAAREARAVGVSGPSIEDAASAGDSAHGDPLGRTPCNNPSPYTAPDGTFGYCVKSMGHKGNHASSDKETW